MPLTALVRYARHVQTARYRLQHHTPSIEFGRIISHFLLFPYNSFHFVFLGAWECISGVR